MPDDITVESKYVHKSITWLVNGEIEISNVIINYDIEKISRISFLSPKKYYEGEYIWISTKETLPSIENNHRNAFFAGYVTNITTQSGAFLIKGQGFDYVLRKIKLQKKTISGFRAAFPFNPVYRGKRFTIEEYLNFLTSNTGNIKTTKDTKLYLNPTPTSVFSDRYSNYIKANKNIYEFDINESSNRNKSVNTIEYEVEPYFEDGSVEHIDSGVNHSYVKINLIDKGDSKGNPVNPRKCIPDTDTDYDTEIGYEKENKCKSAQPLPRLTFHQCSLGKALDIFLREELHLFVWYECHNPCDLTADLKTERSVTDYSNYAKSSGNPSHDDKVEELEINVIYGKFRDPIWWDLTEPREYFSANTQRESTQFASLTYVSVLNADHTECGTAGDPRCLVWGKEKLLDDDNNTIKDLEYPLRYAYGGGETYVVNKDYNKSELEKIAIRILNTRGKNKESYELIFPAGYGNQKFKVGNFFTGLGDDTLCQDADMPYKSIVRDENGKALDPGTSSIGYTNNSDCDLTNVWQIYNVEFNSKETRIVVGNTLKTVFDEYRDNISVVDNTSLPIETMQLIEETSVDSYELVESINTGV